MSGNRPGRPEQRAEVASAGATPAGSWIAGTAGRRRAGEVLDRGLLEQRLLRAGILQQPIEGVWCRELEHVADSAKCQVDGSECGCTSGSGGVARQRGRRGLRAGALAETPGAIFRQHRR